MTVQRALSVFDIVKIPGGKGLLQRNDKEEIETFLFQYGFDVEAGFEYEECFHRPLLQEGNEAVYGVRVVGVERLDHSWITSGNASYEARIEACPDEQMRVDMINMSRQGCADKTFMKYDSKNYDKK